jgi:hypothetical protein
MLLCESATCGSCREDFELLYSADCEGTTRTITAACPRCKLELQVTLAEPPMIWVTRIRAGKPAPTDGSPGPR